MPKGIANRSNAKKDNRQCLEHNSAAYSACDDIVNDLKRILRNTVEGK